MITNKIINDLNFIITKLKQIKSKKIYIYCDQNIFYIMEDYINSINQNLQAKVVFKLDNDIDFQHDFVIFIQTIPIPNINNLNQNIFVLNTEQLSRKIWLNKMLDYSKSFRLIDYSRENIDILNKNNVQNVIYFPYIYNNNEIYNFTKIKNTCGISLNNTPRRKNLINSTIFKNLNIDMINGWNKVRDHKLFKYKILINLSAGDDYNIFETIRCNRCLFNKMIIISDIKHNKDLIDYQNHILFSKIQDMPNLISEVLNNYQYYYNTLNIDNIDTQLNNHLINKNILFSST